MLLTPCMPQVHSGHTSGRTTCVLELAAFGPQSSPWRYFSPLQELDFMAGLVKRAQVSAGTLLETLGLLLPASPEADLLSLVDVLYPRQSLSSAAERDRG